MAKQPTTFSHPTIESIKGTTSSDVVQFQGIQYATLSSRFSPPQLKIYPSNTTLDATTLGPQVLSIAPSPEAEFGLIQHDLPYNKDELSMSDTESLCLNITLPANTRTDAKLPVFVFIHGGGYMVGSGMWPQYDMARFVRLSIGAGRPVIAVVMNYRLGAPGLLYSTSPVWQKAGLRANNSLRDQRTALQWVEKYIAGFGGDAENVTLAGESAGAVSVCYHLFSEEKLFARVVAMSGTHLLLPPMTAEGAEVEFRKASKALGLEEGKEVQALSEMDGNAMVGKLMAAGIRLGPVVDGETVPSAFDFASFQAGALTMPGLQWCKSAMIGDCQFDGSIRALDLGARRIGIASAFCSSVQSAFPCDKSDVAERWLSAYDLSPETEDAEAFERVLRVAHDLNFYAPTLILRDYLHSHQPHLRDEVYTYRFNTSNPWPGPWKGRSTHILDVAFLFQNFTDYLSEEDRVVAKSFGRDVIAFVNGKAPWSSNEARVYGTGGEIKTVSDVPEETGRRGIMIDLAELVGWDRLNEAFGAFTRPVEEAVPSV